ncbi:MAG: type III pantothenate kinase [Planctomycetales bacterium]|nr:type III pantothenate kinase [Planctomycetales bacterium]
MTERENRYLAVNVGNTTTQLALIRPGAAGKLPEILTRIEVQSNNLDLESIEAWLPCPADTPWFISSVFRTADERLRAWIAERYGVARVRRLTSSDFPIQVEVTEPNRVGADRLAAAVAAGHLKSSMAAAIVVDVGTAITVDAIAVDRKFLGGAILPGVGISARALHRYTDALPLVELDPATIPSALGKSTVGAIQSGLHWGVLGAVRRLVDALQAELGFAEWDVFITGGGGHRFSDALTPVAMFRPDLVLLGTAIAAS